MKKYSTLRLILGDQLNTTHSWFQSVSDETVYVIMEIRQETDYAPHHLHKVVAFFLAMRTFGEELRHKGHNVHYISLDAAENSHSLTENLERLLAEYGVKRFEYQEPDEYRLDKQLREFCDRLPHSTAMVSSEHFLTERDSVSAFFKGKKTYLMESFYRAMRKRYSIFMNDDGSPYLDRWNFDAENRKSLPKGIVPPPPFALSHEASHIVAMLQQQGVRTIGILPDGKCSFPVCREEAEAQLHYFIEHLLPFFGDYQDAMTTRHKTLFHSCLSFAMNVKMLSPLDVVKTVEEAYLTAQGAISYSQVEGFIRQVLGWREYMRGVYWAQMPDYAATNYFGYSAPLPQWFWTGDTRMKCAASAIRQSLETAYSHHIQRLMVTGNIALLAETDPAAVDEWYLGIYIDAIEWVEMPNTRGMSQFADGGLVATKPYIGTANYMHKMSDFCKQCYYDRTQKTGERACPLNSLYWNFFERNRHLLEKNPRIGMAYRTLDKMSPSQKTALFQHAEKLLEDRDSW